MKAYGLLTPPRLGGLVHKQSKHDGGRMLMPSELRAAALEAFNNTTLISFWPILCLTIMKDWAVNTNTHSHPPKLVDVQQITSRLGSHGILAVPPHHTRVLLLKSRMMRYLCFALAWVAHLRLSVYHWSALSSSSLYVRLSLLDPMAAIEACNTWTQHMVALVKELQKQA